MEGSTKYIGASLMVFNSQQVTRLSGLQTLYGYPLRNLCMGNQVL